MDWNTTIRTNTKTKMKDTNPKKEATWIDIPKETTRPKKDHTAMTRRTAMMTGISKGQVLDRPTIAIDHTNLILRNIGTIEIVLEAFRELADIKERIIAMIAIGIKKKTDTESLTGKNTNIDIEIRISTEVTEENAPTRDPAKEETTKKTGESSTESRRNQTELKMKDTTKTPTDTKMTDMAIHLTDMKNIQETGQASIKTTEGSMNIEESSTLIVTKSTSVKRAKTIRTSSDQATRDVDRPVVRANLNTKELNDDLDWHIESIYDSRIEFPHENEQFVSVDSFVFVEVEVRKYCFRLCFWNVPFEC